MNLMQIHGHFERMKLRLPRLLLVVLFVSAGVGNAKPINTVSSSVMLDRTLKLTEVTEWSKADLLSPEEAFKAAAKEHNIATKTVHGFKNVYNGYYLIAGVFGVQKNTNAFVRSLKTQNLDPKVFTSPDNGLNYVYLDRFASGSEAIATCLSKIDGKYNSKVWILNVADSKEAPLIKANLIASSKQPAFDVSYKYFKKAAKENNIATRIVSGISNLKDGYYAVAGVYGDKNNVAKFVSRLKANKLEGRTITHPETKLTYVYVKYSSDWEAVLAASISKLDGRYTDKLWIMNIQNNPLPVEPNATLHSDKTEENEVYKPRNTALFSKATRNFLAKDPPNNKLLQKADTYFDKMWYAEAAELYEMVLGNNHDNYTYEIIQKAGDSHYFNTNMERAFHWYDILYNKYKDQISAENIFKYAHSLKGTGKYARAKRLMRIYDKRLKKEGALYRPEDPRTSPKEMILDNILNTEQDYTVKNLATNSEYSDFSPMFYNEDELVFSSAMDSSFFSTRRYKWNNQPYLDLYVAKVNQESQEVKDAIKFSKKINTKYHEASVTFSPDNKTMYFTRNNYGKKLKRDENGVNHLKIYRSKKIDGEWTEATELSFNSDNYSTGHPALSADGKQLYFVSDMPGSIGETDLFVVDVLADGSFSEPRNLGPEINTERKEMFPFINDKKLYFSSNGHVGLGGLDIYEVAFDDENGFLEVRNMGKPVNSKKDDFSYIVNEETQKGFFASNRRGGKGDDDIYSFSRLIPEEINENAIAGVVTEIVTGDVMPEALVTLLDENNIKLKEVVSDENGNFVFEDLDSNTKYTIKTTKGTFSDQMLEVSTKENEVINVAVTMKKLEELIVMEEGIKKLKLDMIFFDFDKSYIRPDAALELDKLLAVMNENPSMVIKIESHTDSRGKNEYNKYLSDKRAKSTRAYLISKGIDPKRIESAIGYGEERLLNECDGTVRCSSEKHQLNRRSEFIIVNM